MLIAFVKKNLTVVTLQNVYATPVRESLIGQTLIDFYNYVLPYCNKNGQALFYSFGTEKIPTNEVQEIIRNYPLSSELTVTRGQVQSFFNALKYSINQINETKIIEEKYQLSATITNYIDDEFGNLKPYKYTACMAMLKNKPAVVFEVTSIEEYLSLEFYYSFFSDKPQKIGVCPSCGKMFFRIREDSVYCCNKCYRKTYEEKENENPYYKKYRRLCQRYNSITNKQVDTTDYPLLSQKYNTWQTWAKDQCDSIIKKSNNIPPPWFKALQLSYPEKYGVYIEPDIPSPEDFANILKSKWEELGENI